MPPGVSGALVHRVCAVPDGPFDITWLPADPPKLLPGRIRLHWEPASAAGWNITAHLGLPATEVLLATWPNAPDTWPHLVRPTLYEVTGLCAALGVATAALGLANHLAET